jgi:hypothetical protein
MHMAKIPVITNSERTTSQRTGLNIKLPVYKRDSRPFHVKSCMPRSTMALRVEMMVRWTEKYPNLPCTSSRTAMVLATSNHSLCYPLLGRVTSHLVVHPVESSLIGLTWADTSCAPSGVCGVLDGVQPRAGPYILLHYSPTAAFYLTFSAFTEHSLHYDISGRSPGP